MLEIDSLKKRIADLQKEKKELIREIAASRHQIQVIIKSHEEIERLNRVINESGVAATEIDGKISMLEELLSIAKEEVKENKE